MGGRVGLGVPRTQGLPGEGRTGSAKLKADTRAGPKRCGARGTRRPALERTGARGSRPRSSWGTPGLTGSSPLEFSCCGARSKFFRTGQDSAPRCPPSLSVFKTGITRAASGVSPVGIPPPSPG